MLTGRKRENLPNWIFQTCVVAILLSCCYACKIPAVRVVIANVIQGKIMMRSRFYHFPSKKLKGVIGGLLRWFFFVPTFIPKWSSKTRHLSSVNRSNTNVRTIRIGFWVRFSFFRARIWVKVSVRFNEVQCLNIPRFCWGFSVGKKIYLDIIQCQGVYPLESWIILQRL